MSTDDILILSVPALLKLYRGKELSPVDVCEAVLAQVERCNPDLNAFVLVKDSDALLAEARQSEERWQAGAPQGVLDGIPVTIKDGYDVTGWPTREGSLAMPDTPAESDSPNVARLRGQGALFLGKTTTPEFGHKGVTDSPAFGITRNPWNPALTPGGSSGGSGAAAATRMGCLHLGSDGGGSIRIPSGFCGVFGIKPTPGRIPGWPPSPFAPLASSGPMAGTVDETALMLDVLVAQDPQGGFYTGLEETPGKKLRLAYAPTINDVVIDPEVTALVEKAAGQIGAFADVEQIKLEIPGLVETFNTHWMAIAAWLQSKFSPEKRGKLDPYLRKFADMGENIALNAYVDGQVARMMIEAQMQELFDRFDALILPVTPCLPFAAGQDAPTDESGVVNDDWTPLTFPANLARLPAASLPCGISRDGLPVGIQIVAATMRDDVVLNIAHRLEQLLGFESWLVRNNNMAASETVAARANA